MTPGSASAGPLPLAILILARDEADALGRTLPSITACVAPGDRLHVVADHCRDATAAVAHRFGASVHVRDGRQGEPGKGRALGWWLEHTAGTPEGEGPVVILDADSLPAPGFFEAMRRRLARGEPAVQALLEPELEADTGVGLLAAYSEIVEQRVFDRARARRGWPVRMRGTGMAFAREIVERAGPRLSTLAEDVELTLLLGAWGVPISLALEASVLDPKPPDAAAAIRQRARWVRGQLQVVRVRWREVVRLLLRGPAGWSLLGSALFKPKAIILPFKGLVAIGGFLAWAATRSWLGLALGAWAAASLSLDGAGLLVGLRLIDDRAARRRVLAAVPTYLWIWLRSLALSAVTRERWLRSRPASTAVRTSELPGEL